MEEYGQLLFIKNSTNLPTAIFKSCFLMAIRRFISGAFEENDIEIMN
jgi:hypothetical protein